MRIEATISGKTVPLSIRRRNDGTFEVDIDPEGDRKRFTVQLLGRVGHRWTLRIGERIEDVLIDRRDHTSRVERKGRSYSVEVFSLQERLLHKALSGGQAGSGLLVSQMPGKVVRVLRQEGDQVESGHGLAVIEAMKMQNELKAPKSGRIKSCRIVEGQAVEAGDTLFEIE